MEVIKNFFQYLAAINFESWQDTFIRLFSLIALFLVLLWVVYSLFNRFRPADRQAYNGTRDFELDVNFIWAFGVVFVLFSGFWLYALFFNGLDNLKYSQGSFWLGLMHILTIYVLMTTLFLFHLRNTTRKIKI